MHFFYALFSGTSRTNKPDTFPQAQDGVLTVSLNKFLEGDDFISLLDNNLKQKATTLNIEYVMFSGHYEKLSALQKYIDSSKDIKRLKITLKNLDTTNANYYIFMKTKSSTLEHIEIRSGDNTYLELTNTTANAIKHMILDRQPGLQTVDLSLVRVNTKNSVEKIHLKDIAAIYSKRLAPHPTLTLTVNGAPFVIDETVVTDPTAFHEKLDKAFERLEKPGF